MGIKGQNGRTYITLKTLGSYTLMMSDGEYFMVAYGLRTDEKGEIYWSNGYYYMSNLQAAVDCFTEKTSL